MAQNRPHRQRRDSVQAIARAFFERTLGPLPVPKHLRLRPQDKPFWDAVISSKGRAEWHVAQLPLAAECARTMADITALQGQQANKARGALIKQELSMLRALGIIGCRAPRRPRLPVIDDAEGLIAR